MISPLEIGKRPKIVIAGGTGALGKLLTDFYRGKDWDIVILTRSHRPPVGTVRYVMWDGRTLGTWTEELVGAAAVVNLAGRSLNTRFTASKKQEILDSRIQSTTIIGEAIGSSKHPPSVWINAGGISIFGSSTTLKTEADIPDGTGFPAIVSRRWEAAFAAAATPATRKVQLRISAVLLSEGGVLAPLVKLTKLGLGGTIGSGNQYLSWIHERDFVKLVDWSISNQGITGIIHASSPNPVRNRDFMKALRQRLGLPVGLPTPAWAVRIGARLIGTEPELVLSGNRIVSKTLADEGFEFSYPEITDALRTLALRKITN